MKRVMLLVCLLALGSLACAGDIRKMVREAGEGPIANATIDPERHIFGIPFGTSEDEVIKRLGKPEGYIQLGGDESAMIYGKEVFLIFHAKKLGGVRITLHVVDSDLAQRMAPNKAFDNLRNRWKLDNGVQAGMSLGRTKELLGAKLHVENGLYRASYVTRTASVQFEFYLPGPTAAEEDESSRTLHSVTVEKTR